MTTHDLVGKYNIIGSNQDALKNIYKGGGMSLYKSSNGRISPYSSEYLYCPDFKSFM